MAAFKGLNKIIRESIRKETSTRQPTFPGSTPEAALLGQDIRYVNPVYAPSTGSFRWGFSTWGVDSIIGVDFPENR